MTTNVTSMKQLLEGFDKLTKLNEADNKSNLMDVNYKFPFRKNPMVGQGFEGTLQEGIDRKIVSEKTQRNLKEVQRLSKLAGSDLTWTHFVGILVLQAKDFVHDELSGSRKLIASNHKQVWTYVVLGKDRKGNLFGFDRRETAHPGAGQTWISINKNTDRIGHSLTLQFFVDSLSGKKLVKKDVQAQRDFKFANTKTVSKSTSNTASKTQAVKKEEPAKKDMSASIYGS